MVNSYVGISIFVGIVIIALSYWRLYKISYQKGYTKGIQDKEDFARHALSVEAEKQQWGYEDSINPMWRQSKITGETQRRYIKASSVAEVAIQGPHYTEWRSTKPKEEME